MKGQFNWFGKIKKKKKMLLCYSKMEQVILIELKAVLILV